MTSKVDALVDHYLNELEAQLRGLPATRRPTAAGSRPGAGPRSPGGRSPRRSGMRAPPRPEPSDRPFTR